MNNLADLVSIIVPSYKGQRFVHQLCDCLDSYHGAGVEILVVENGTKDGVEEVLRERLPNARYIWQEKASAGLARSTGAAMASGKYLQFLDVDDTIAADKLKTQVTHAIRYDLDLVYSDWRYVIHNDQGRECKGWVSAEGQDLIQVIVEESWHPLHSFLFKKSTFERLGGFSEQFNISCEDSDLLFSFLLHHSQGYVPGHFSSYHRYPQWGTLSNIRNHLYWKDHELLMSRHMQELMNYKGGIVKKALIHKRFVISRNLSQWDLHAGREAYLNVLKTDPGFQPEHESFAYRFFYRILGFSLTERLLRLRSTLKPDYRDKSFEIGFRTENKQDEA